MVLDPNLQVPQSILDQWSSLQNTIKTQGVKSDTGQTLVAPGQYNPATNTITPPSVNNPPPTIPPTNTITTDTSAAGAYNAAIQASNDADQKAIDQAKADRAAAQKAIGSSTPPKSLSEYLSSQGQQTIPNYTATTEESAIETYTGMTKAQEIAQQRQYTAQIASYQKNIDDATAAKDQAIADAQGKLAPMSFINNQVAQINRNYNAAVATPLAEINRVSALSATLKGDIQQAEAFTDKMVTAYTQQAQNDLKTFDEFLTYNQNIISNANTTIQNALQDTLNNQKDALAQQQADLKYKASLYNSAGMSVDVDKLNSMTVAEAIANTSAKIASKSNTTGYYDSFAQGLADANPNATPQEIASEAVKTAVAKAGENGITLTLAEQNTIYNNALKVKSKQQPAPQTTPGTGTNNSNGASGKPFMSINLHPDIPNSPIGKAVGGAANWVKSLFKK